MCIRLCLLLHLLCFPICREAWGACNPPLLFVPMALADHTAPCTRLFPAPCLLSAAMPAELFCACRSRAAASITAGGNQATFAVVLLGTKKPIAALLSAQQPTDVKSSNAKQGTQQHSDLSTEQHHLLKTLLENRAQQCTSPSPFARAHISLSPSCKASLWWPCRSPQALLLSCQPYPGCEDAGWHTEASARWLPPTH